MPQRFFKYLLLIALCSPTLMAKDRLITLAPNLTELVCALGSCEDLVGVTEFCSFPQSVRSVAKVGGYMDPNPEIILAMKPTLILALPEHQDVTARLKRLGLRVETIRNWNVADIFASIQKAGALLNKKEQAAALTQRLKNDVKRLTRNREKPIRCLVTLGHDVSNGMVKDAYIVGRKGFLYELLQMAGGENVYQKDQPHFPKIGQETMIQLNPDVIIDLVPQENPDQRELDKRKNAWAKIPHLTSVREGRYHIIHAEHVLQAGPRFTEILAELVRILDAT